MTDLWVSCPWATGMVTTDDKTIITKTPPVWRKFIGQSLRNLVRWLGKDVCISYLNKKEKEDEDNSKCKVARWVS